MLFNRFCDEEIARFPKESKQRLLEQLREKASMITLVKSSV